MKKNQRIIKILVGFYTFVRFLFSCFCCWRMFYLFFLLPNRCMLRDCRRELTTTKLLFIYFNIYAATNYTMVVSWITGYLQLLYATRILSKSRLSLFLLIDKKSQMETSKNKIKTRKSCIRYSFYLFVVLFNLTVIALILNVPLVFVVDVVVLTKLKSS